MMTEILIAVLVVQLVQIGVSAYWYVHRYDPPSDFNSTADVALPPTPPPRDPCPYCGSDETHSVMYDMNAFEFARNVQLSRDQVKQIVATRLPDWRMDVFSWRLQESGVYKYVCGVKKPIACGTYHEIQEKMRDFR